jgi:hypothetical protein
VGGAWPLAARWSLKSDGDTGVFTPADVDEAVAAALDAEAQADASG